MIRNIIFDLGNVLLSFKPEEFLAGKKYPEEKIRTIMDSVFRSREWSLMANGDIDINDAVKGISSRTTLSAPEIRSIFDLRTELMFPIEQNIKLLPELKKRGYRLYYLSNFPADIFPEVKNSYPFFNYFDGGVISAYVRLSKPDERIYEHLLEKYNLNAEESVFIDDLEVNVSAAKRTGMFGIVNDDKIEISVEIEKVLSVR